MKADTVSNKLIKVSAYPINGIVKDTKIIVENGNNNKFRYKK